MMLPVWLMGLRKLWVTCFQPLHDSVLRLWKDNGSLWLTQYLSLSCRIIVLWVGGQPYVESTPTVRVRLTRCGLPAFLPNALRKIFLLLRGEDHAYALRVIRVTLTILSVYRVIGCQPNLKISTITGPFSGLAATLAVWEVSQAVGLLPRSLAIAKASWTYLSESAGPNFKRSTWSSGLDALAFIRDPLVWYHWIAIAVAQRAWVLLSWNLFTVLVSLPVLPLLLVTGKLPKRLGKLATLFEARGKVRVVAITDWWTQALLAPLHEGLFTILRSIPQDGTFCQLGPVHLLISYVRASGAPVYSYDLSAATDRLPIAFQIQVLEALGVSWAVNWAALLVVRPWYLQQTPVFYAVGQPMGALSSWAILAVSHHLLVQIAARRAGVRGWFTHYALLGDDIIIADKAVASAYLTIMTDLGVTINLSKSFEMESGTCEFAKRWISPTMGDISPMGPGLVLAAVRNPRMIGTLFKDALQRDFVFSTHVVRDLVRFLRMIRPVNWMNRQLKPILSSVFGPTGGLWGSASGPFFKAVWIKLFPSDLIRNKLTTLCSLLLKLSHNETPPPSGKDLSRQIVSRFWERSVLFGSNLWGLISMPLIVFSPSFWVYWDLVGRADAKLGDWLESSEISDRLWAGHRAIMFARGWTFSFEEAFKDLTRDECDPGLLDWDRKVAEAMVKVHSRLITEWAKLAAKYPTGRPSPSRPPQRKPYIYRPVPRNLSLVPMSTYAGYPWDKSFSYPRPRLW
jgi:hypothetical protein